MHSILEGLPEHQSKKKKTGLLQLSNFAHVTREVLAEHREKDTK